MYDGTEQNLKQAQARADQTPMPADTCNKVSGAAIGRGYYKPTPQEELEKAAHHHGEQLHLKSRGADFLRDHPEFNEFITLIRAGALGI